MNCNMSNRSALCSLVLLCASGWSCQRTQEKGMETGKEEAQASKLATCYEELTGH